MSFRRTGRGRGARSGGRARLSSSQGAKPRKGRKFKLGAELEQQTLQHADANLQNEYVTNLQQQIYFLELELQVMKEKASSGQFAGKTSISNSAPLDTHMNSLRDKYFHMENKFKKKVKSLRDELDDAVKRNTEHELATSRLRDELELAQEDTRELREFKDTVERERLEDRLRLEDKITVLQGKLEVKSKLLDEKTQAFHEYRCKTKKESDALRDTISTQKKELARKEKDTEAHQAAKLKAEQDLLDTQETMTLKDERIAELEKEVKGHLDDIRDLEHAKKKLEVDVEQGVQWKANLERDQQALKKENAELELALKAERRKVDSVARSEDRWSGKIVELRQQIDTLKQDAVEQAAAAEQRRNEFDLTKEELDKAVETAADTAERIEQDTEAIAALEAEAAKLREEKLQMDKEDILKTQRLEKLILDHTELTNTHDDTVQQLEAKTAHCNELERKVQIAENLENIDINEFQNLCTSNLKMADTIRTLMDAVKPRPKPKETELTAIGLGNLGKAANDYAASINSQAELEAALSRQAEQTSRGSASHSRRSPSVTSINDA